MQSAKILVGMGGSAVPKPRKRLPTREEICIGEYSTKQWSLDWDAKPFSETFLCRECEMLVYFQTSSFEVRCIQKLKEDVFVFRVIIFVG